MKTNFKWEPWVLYAEEPEELSILEPPCSHCEYWQPVREFAEYKGRQHYEGVKLCHNDNQEQDFSCFKLDSREKE